MLRSILAIRVVLLTASAWSVASDGNVGGNIDLAKAGQYFKEMDALCSEDDGKLWGVSFCGPLLFVDPSSRMAVANRADKEGVLEPRAGVFVGRLPDDVGIANTAIEWGGTRWTMLMWWSLSEDRARRSRLLAHEAFHRIQPELGLDTYGEINAHLDTAKGRYWIQLEWDALAKALLSEGDARREAVADGLTFRAARQMRFPEAAEREIPLEIFEGLAEYSGMRLAGYSPERVVEAVAAKREGETGLVRSFAYISGPLYGYLLDASGAEWRDRMGPEVDMGALLGKSLGVAAGSDEKARTSAESYGGSELRRAETDRERERNTRLAAWRKSLIDGPVLVVDLNAVSSGGFDPGKVFPFAEKQTVYTVRELIAEWGVLTVDGGAILEDDGAGRGHLSLSGVSQDLTEGEGWTLELAEGWKIFPAERAGDFVVREVRRD
jgi:hypothetical protein